MHDHHEPTQISGAITDIFAHRFVIETRGGRILADLGPKGATKAALRLGETVDLVGVMKPSELKVSRIVRDGETIDIEHDEKKRAHDDGAVDLKSAIDAVRATGVTVIGQPRRKPKHFEILTRDASGGLAEVHVKHDGTIHKSKPVKTTDEKWTATIENAKAEA